MKAKIMLAVLVSFVIYLFPIPTLHANLMWGETLWNTVWNSHLITPLGRILTAIFAIAYQCFAIFCIYQLLKLKPLKIFVLSLPLMIFLYIGLVVGVYITAFIIYSLEQMLGIGPV